MPGEYLTLNYVQQFLRLWPLYKKLNWQFTQAGFRLVRGSARIFSPLVSVALQLTSLKIHSNLIQLKVVHRNKVRPKMN